MQFPFFIVDDLDLDCLVAKKMVQRYNLSNEIKVYTNAVLLLKEIADDKITNINNIILLDILMPIMDAFQFLEEFEKLPHEVQNKYKVISTSTTLNQRNFDKIFSFKSVIGLLKKPYTIDQLRAILKTANF